MVFRPLVRRAAVSSLWSVLSAAFFLAIPMLHAQVTFVPTIVRVAGTVGTPGLATPNGVLATNATLNDPEGIAFDRAGNLYIADSANLVVRKLDVNGTITTFAGGGANPCPSNGCIATDAAFLSPARVAVDGLGFVYISDYLACVIYKVNPASGQMTQYAGVLNACTEADGTAGPAGTGQMYGPVGMAFDAANEMYIADYNSGIIRKVDANDSTLTTIAGGGSGACLPTVSDSVGDGCPAQDATFSSLIDLATDGQGNVYVSDQGDFIIRKITAANGTVTGNSTTTVYAGTLGQKCTGVTCGDGGPATSATLGHPKGLEIDGVGNLYFGDYDNSVVREVNAIGNINTVAGEINNSGTPINSDLKGDVATGTEMNSPVGLALDPAGDVYVADYFNQIVQKVNLSGTTSFLGTAVGQTSLSQNVFFQVTTGGTPPIVVGANFSDFTATSPSCTPNGGGNLCSVAVTFALLDMQMEGTTDHATKQTSKMIIVADPIMLEEELGGRLTVALNRHGKIVTIVKSGGDAVPLDLVTDDALVLARSRACSLLDAIQSAIVRVRSNK